MTDTSQTLARWSALATGVSALVFAPIAAEAARGGVRHAAPSSVSGGQHRAGNANPSRNAGANRAGERASNVSGNRAGNASGNRAGNASGNRSGNMSGNRSRNTNINTGDVNVGNRTNINIDNDNGWHDWDDDYHPVARGVAFGTAAAVTSAAIGSMIYSLPPSCAPYPYSGYTYYSCGGAWYQPQYQGTTVTYVVVQDPR